MLPLFCVRLAFGLASALLLCPARIVNPRFFRAHLLTILALVAGAGMLLGETSGAAVKGVLGVAALLSLAGSVSWSLDRAPAGRWIIAFTAASTGVALALISWNSTPMGQAIPALADSFSSAILLGLATTAMLLGHSYLIAPTMSLRPLRVLLGSLIAALAARAMLGVIGLWFWTASHSLVNLEDETVLWLPLRWGLGLIAPLVLVWMAWQAARIRSTQSATGILYVVVIFCFLGELTSQLLFESTGLSM